MQMEKQQALPLKSSRMVYKAASFRVSLVRDTVAQGAPLVADRPELAAQVFRPFVADTDREHFMVAMVNARSEVIGVSVVSIGTVSASLVHPRETFKPAILANAAAVIVSHNHPSGDPEPSAEDRECTRRLQRAGELLGIPLLDHVIIGAGESFYSFKAHGVL